MVYYPNSMAAMDRRREIIEQYEPDFPYAAMESELAVYPERSTPWHWHEYFEFVTVMRGCLRLRTPRSVHIIEEGGGYFINASVLHKNATARVDVGAHLRAQLFDRSLIAGTGLMSRRYVSPVENCAALEAVLFSSQDAAGRRLMDELDGAFAAAEDGGAGHELRICAHLNAAWALLFERIRDQICDAEKRCDEDSARLKIMLGFIHENYAQNLSVREIAASAGVCERECFREFAQNLEITPMAYLTRHRMDAAARALAATNDTVAQIAENCGFLSASYFGKVFRRFMGCTPLEYRRGE